MNSLSIERSNYPVLIFIAVGRATYTIPLMIMRNINKIENRVSASVALDE